jgi:transposase
MALLCAELRIGLPHHRRSLGSFCLSGPQSPFTLGLYRRALILSHLCSRLCALASYGAWRDRPYVVAARGRTAGLMAGVAMAINGGAECLKKQRKIDRLTEELQRLKQKLRSQERQATEGFFGSATPSAKRPVKVNTPPPKALTRKGAQPGQPGAGRHAFDASQAERVVDIAPIVTDRCPDCAGLLADKGTESRAVLESRPGKAERLLYRLPKRYCPRCRQTFQPRAPAVLPKSLYGNQLLATATTMPYLHGIPLGKVCEQTGLGPGSVVEVCHRVARLFAGIPDRLIQEYRQAPVKHADETSWRTIGKNGYAWLFATPRLSLFLFRQTRAASVPQQVFGKPWLPGCLVVDRYGGDNKVPCTIQYCYSHLLREVQALEKEFPETAEVKTFVSTVAPQLALAMGLRSQPRSDHEFSRQAAALKAQIIATLEAPAQHLGIRRLQEIFRVNADRLYHWADDRRVPAENNLAERDLRPTVIARKVRFGSQSDAGAHTRGVLMSVLHTLKKRQVDVVAQLKRVLDQLAIDIHQDPFPLLFPTDST